MRRKVLLSLVVCGALYSVAASAESKNVAGLDITYQTLALPVDQMESHGSAQITVNNAYERLYDIKTVLAPGCSKLPAISNIVFAGKTLPVLCGNTGGGRNETLQILGSVSGGWVFSTLGFGQMEADMQVRAGDYYFLTADYSDLIDQGLFYKVYKLAFSPASIGFVPSRDQQARDIYRSVLDNYLRVGLQGDRYVLEFERLVVQSGLSVKDACRVLTEGRKKLSSNITDALVVGMEKQHLQACKGK